MVLTKIKINTMGEVQKVEGEGQWPLQSIIGNPRLIEYVQAKLQAIDVGEDANSELVREEVKNTVVDYIARRVVSLENLKPNNSDDLNRMKDFRSCVGKAIADEVISLEGIYEASKQEDDSLGYALMDVYKKAYSEFGAAYGEKDLYAKEPSEIVLKGTKVKDIGGGVREQLNKAQGGSPQ